MTSEIRRAPGRCPAELARRSSSPPPGSAPSTAASCRSTRLDVDARASASGSAGGRSRRSALYVPGGTAAYPSSVLMNAIPARVAGVRAGGRWRCRRPTACSIRWCWPPPGSPGVDEIYRIGGAQAVGGAGLTAPGTIRAGRQDRRARQRLRGRGQAPGVRPGRDRHDRRPVGDRGRRRRRRPTRPGSRPTSSPRPSTTSAPRRSWSPTTRGLPSAVGARGRGPAAPLCRAAIAAASWRDLGAIILLRSARSTRRRSSTALAPEHLELSVAARPRRWRPHPPCRRDLPRRHTPEVIGDYVGGPNHVLPTGRTARFASGLAVYDFLKRTTLLGCGRGSSRTLAPAGRRAGPGRGAGGARARGRAPPRAT